MHFFTTIDRREMLAQLARIYSLGIAGSAFEVFTSGEKKQYKISACDWSIGKRNDPAAMEYGKSLGLDGVQVSLGSVANNMHLRQKSVQQTYKNAASKYKIEVSGLAIGELNKVPYKSAPETELWVSDAIDVAKAMNCKVILLAFFEKGDLLGDQSGQEEVIRRLKKVTHKAEDLGIILGIESWLSAEQHLDIIREVGSENVRVYYDLANSNLKGYDIYEEIKKLGSKYICEIHAKENGYLLGKGNIDFLRIKQILDLIDYKGWVVLEGALPKGADLTESCLANVRFLKSTLNS
ncbi:sugar phosphate isomerase/epimerase family protein [Flavitalea antarctica]